MSYSDTAVIIVQARRATLATSEVDESHVVATPAPLVNKSLHDLGAAQRQTALNQHALPFWGRTYAT